MKKDLAQIKMVLNRLLIGNDKYIGNLIMDFLTLKCVICDRITLVENITEIYCENYHFPRQNYPICKGCKTKYHYYPCIKCHLHRRGSFMYIYDKNNSFICPVCYW